MADKAKFDKPIYVICGKDEYQAAKKCQQIVDSILSPDEKAVSLFNAEADKVTPAQVFDELRTISFFGGRRVVLLKNADKFISANRQLLENYFDKPADTGVLILTVPSWSKSTKLSKKLQNDQLFQIEEIKGYKLADYIVNYVKTEHNKLISKNAAVILAELIGNDPGRLASEIDKLAIYDIDKKKIEMDDISKLVAGSRFFDAFNVIDAMGSGDTAKAINQLRKMFTMDKSSQYTVVGAFAYHFRQMFTAKAMLNKGSSIAEVVKKCRIWANKEAIISRIRNLSLQRIGWMLEELATIDHQIKTGGAEVAPAMEQLVIKCSMINKRAV